MATHEELLKLNIGDKVLVHGEPTKVIEIDYNDRYEGQTIRVSQGGFVPSIYDEYVQIPGVTDKKLFSLEEIQKAFNKIYTVHEGFGQLRQALLGVTPVVVVEISDTTEEIVRGILLEHFDEDEIFLHVEERPI